MRILNSGIVGAIKAHQICRYTAIFARRGTKKVCHACWISGKSYLEKEVRTTDISTKHIDEVIERAYLSGKNYVTLALTGDNNVDKALTRKLDEDGYKVALNDDNIMVSWGF